MTTAPTTLDVRKIAGHIGAEISGVDLADELSAPVVAAIRAALLEHRVVFFRGQRLDAEHQEAFARRFGSPTTAHPTVPSLDGSPAVLDLDYGRTTSRANNWHTDVTFVRRPPLGSILRAVTIPPYGGDTVWANTVRAYATLPVELRELADRLWAVHSNAYDYVSDAREGDDSEVARRHREVFTSTEYVTEHPVVRVHPETGERALVLGGFVRRFVGWTGDDSRDLLRLLQRHVTALENTVRWRWHAGDVVFWDNRATQHYAVADYGDQARRVQRITLVGDVPVSVSGERSRSVAGDDTSYNTALARSTDAR
ncbi:TauD/TfdA dioxygenase family protein [Streptomyces silvisoli]|uniref:TauD/TfdA family dioxygenase n=1 Tax=Streptomyces silvisoli TaxID=3034235 RepID=A0ABT5ZKQ2_9ACTN|nr:TauD/TfdA family dioxygenase [Streptomyces silvisoli]MDF3289568.1 TauD/TfdA family dioxygenase [Streptomyces silvisoli]